MFTSEDPQEIVVLKAVAFQHAARRARHLMSAQRSHTASTLCQASHAAPHRCGHGEMRGGLDGSRTRESLVRSNATRSAPCFTFRLPVSLAAASSESRGGEDRRGTRTHSYGARIALGESLQQHEDALRSWANEPAQHVPLRIKNAIGVGVKPPASLSSGAEAAPYSLQWHTGGLHSHRRPEANIPSPRVAVLTRSYCRVLAQGSVCDTGVPVTVVSEPTAQQGPTVPSIKVAPQDAPRGEIHETPWEASKSENRCIASTSLSSSTPKSYHDSERAVTSAHATALAPGAPGVSPRVMQPSPYQLPVRLGSFATSSAQQPASAAATSSPLPTDSYRRAFLDEQAKRYAHWRNRQAAVLHEVAPDMWGRALPHRAALDRQPHVMDSGFCTHTSYVARSQYDCGVVIA